MMDLFDEVQDNSIKNIVNNIVKEIKVGKLNLVDLSNCEKFELLEQLVNVLKNLNNHFRDLECNCSVDG